MTVRAQRRHPVAGPDTRCVESSGELEYATVELGVGEREVAVDDRGPPGEGLGCAGEENPG
jgi:hypothetical protein